jgi:lysyl-tRNA synthetase class 2
MLEKARSFFKERGVLEVDCCALVSRPPIDANIDVISAAVTGRDTGYLHTSPEYAMKRLLSLGSGDIYYLGHVFRKGDIGRIHNPEFAMVEWYRVAISFDQMIQETAEFLFLFIGEKPIRKIGYRAAFKQYAGIDYTAISLSELRKMIPHAEGWSRDTCIHYLLTHLVEPKLGRGELTALIDFPTHEAALACVAEKDGERVAERFEIYFEGIELTNGYHELRDSTELKRRFDEENRERMSKGKEPYLLDEEFIACLDNGFPDCCGVSVGFDRVLMLRNNAQSIKDVLPFAWETAPAI